MDDKLRLTTWLCQNRVSTFDAPTIDESRVKSIHLQPLLTIPARCNEALRFIGKNIRQVGNSIEFNGDHSDLIMQKILAETESDTYSELVAILTLLDEMGELKLTKVMSGKVRANPTAKGWTTLDRDSKKALDSTQAFVAMWFDPSVSEAYTEGIEKAITAAGYSPLRIDKKEHNDKIDDQIIAEIRKSRFIVADFTCDTGAVRGGVYYEAGFAHGLGIPVIWSCRKSSLPDLHFDTRQYAHLIWETNDELYEMLKNRIEATIGPGPLPFGENA